MNTQRTASAPFGLIAWLEQIQIHLPLKAVTRRFEVSGAAADVQIDQVFHQSVSRPLDVTYSFPLPSKAAVYRCEMVVNDRTIRAKVVERAAARRLAKQKKAEGRRTALVEMERGNLFTLSLGNVQPNDIIVIRFAYFEELDAWKDELALQIPFTPGVRYIPGEPLLRSNCGRGAVDDTDQVPDASRISPPRIDQMHPDAARLSLSGKLDGRDVDLCSISSPTHPTAVRPVADTFEIFLPANAAVPDRDFVLRWRRAARPDLLSAAWISSDPEATYALIQLRASDEVTVENREGSDIYFLVDRSGSMAGEKWAKTAEALIAFVNAAAQRDRVWITFFESDYQDFAEKPLERDTLLRDPNFQSLAKLGTDGGTDLLPALRHVLTIEQRYSTQRRSHVVLITDGQVGNEEAVLQAVSGHALPVHCFGIDHAVNEAFLRQLAGQQRGTSVFLTPNDDLVRPIAILGSRLNRPVLTDLALDGGWELADTDLPDIHAGQVVFASIRTGGERTDINVAGKDTLGRPLTLALATQAAETDLPKLIWMKHRIDSLLQRGENSEAIALAEKANLVCRGAAFIAWDDAEKVAVAEGEVYQPSLLAEEQDDVMSGKMICAKSPWSRSVASKRASKRVFSSTSSLSLSENNVTEYRSAPFLDDAILSDAPGLTEKIHLIEQTRGTIESAFCADDAKKLNSIISDWAKHTDEKQVRDALYALLRECELQGDAGYLKKVLSNFFLALTDPWKTRASSIMDKQYEELSRRASKGDADALFELFALAEQRKGEGNFNQATVAFRDAAIGYRTFAFRNLDRVKDADSRSAWLAEECNIYRRWIENNPNGLRELPYPAAGITRECIRHVVVDQLLEEDSFAALFSFLLTTLSSMGVEFFSPGGSIQRRVCALLGAVFGLEGSEESEYLRNTAVRIALDPIADEVTKRKQEGKVPPSLEEFENELAREL